jgi:hypothetical protein
MQLLALASPAIVCVCVERGGIDSPGIFSLISRVAFESRMHASGTEKENVSAACCIVHASMIMNQLAIVSPNPFFRFPPLFLELRNKAISSCVAGQREQRAAV